MEFTLSFPTFDWTFKILQRQVVSGVYSLLLYWDLQKFEAPSNEWSLHSPSLLSTFKMLRRRVVSGVYSRLLYWGLQKFEAPSNEWSLHSPSLRSTFKMLRRRVVSGVYSRLLYWGLQKFEAPSNEWSLHSPSLLSTGAFKIFSRRVVNGIYNFFCFPYHSKIILGTVPSEFLGAKNWSEFGLKTMKCQIVSWVDSFCIIYLQWFSIFSTPNSWWSQLFFCLLGPSKSCSAK